MELNEAALLVAEIVRGTSEITGANLARQLKSRSASWSPKAYGVQSLRAFIAQHVPSVVVAGRSGMDLIYRASPLDGPTTPSNEPDLWQTWVSPNSPYALFVDRTCGTVIARERRDTPTANEAKLTPLTVASHQCFAREFLTTYVDVGQEQDLKALINSDNPSWWQPWFVRLKRLGLASKWSAFRRQKFLDQLDEHLRELSLPSAAVDHATKMIRSKARTQIAQVPAQNLQAVPTTPSSDSLARARAVAIRAIERMTEQEIRELRLPLGYLLDIAKETDL